MSLLGFDAIGRLALGQNPGGSGVLAAVYGGSFHIWNPAPKPQNFSKDFIAFADNISINAPVYTQPFSPFSPPPKPKNFARDWIAFSGDYFVQTTTLSFFTEFSHPPKPPQFAKDWIAFSGSEPTEDFPTIGIDFMPFSPGFTRKLWTIYGQQPQWWTYEFKAPIAKPKDRHDYGWPVRSYHRPHPTVYEQEYYDAVNRRWVNAPAAPEPEPAPTPRVPNLLIPINRLIQPRAIPSLHVAPPPRPMPTLTMNPPAFHMATPEEKAMDDAAIIRALLEE